MLHKKKEVILFFSQLTTLYAAGINLMQCITIMQTLHKKSFFTPCLLLLHESLLRGATLNSVFRQFPQHFEPLTCQLISLGEKTGKLDVALQNITNYYKTKTSLLQDLKNALFYPCCLLFLASLIFLFLLVFIIPKFAVLYADTHTPLPLLTMWLFNISYFITHHLAALTCLFFGSLLLLILTAYNKIFCDLKYLLYRAPCIRNYYAKVMLVQFTQQFVIAYSAGIALVQSFQLASSIVPEHLQQFKFLPLVTMLQNGQALHETLASSPFFPDFFCQLCKIGEESGKLETTLKEGAQLLENDINEFLTSLKQSAEPLIMLTLGVVIGLVVVSLYLPIFNLGTTF